MPCQQWSPDTFVFCLNFLCNVLGTLPYTDSSVSHVEVVLSLMASEDSTSLCAEASAENSVVLLALHLYRDTTWKSWFKLCSASLFQALVWLRARQGLCLFRPSVWIHGLIACVLSLPSLCYPWKRRKTNQKTTTGTFSGNTGKLKLSSGWWSEEQGVNSPT